MTVLRKISWLELKLFAREPVTVLFTLTLPLVILYVLGGVFTDPPTLTSSAGSAGRTTTSPRTSVW